MYLHGVNKVIILEWNLIKMSEPTLPKELLDIGDSSNKNFFIKDTIGNPHPYCITHKHITGEDVYLDKDVIMRLEREGKAKCGVRGCNLSYEEHEIGLLIGCKKDMNESEELKEEFQEYVKHMIPFMEKYKYNGFVLLDLFSGN